ncbi:ribokinase [Roseomonas terrae]|jgi:ribokinase|uniref:Ribokinase n=1 Tax=Neoroseomonas terrae TaxID=424799 RepID=A0ABS5EMH4_9PROT|nr:PfkB family carbohydrate kinase [Neoroseomonas terrae]MBR0652224.1 ribokinase [Neoroseomonas terrae]
MRRIVVIGSYNRDSVLAVPRFPQPGETLAATRIDRFHGGKGSNQAVAAARAGAAVAMVAAVGNDAAGEAARGLWATEGIDASGVATLDALPTGEALILVDDAGENEIVILAGANGALSGEAASAAVPGAGLVLAQLETPVAATEAAFRAARMRAIPTLLNAAPAQMLPAALLELTDMLVVNESEAALLLGRAGGPEALARALAPRHAEGVVVTAGGAGAWWAGRDGSVLFAPALPTKVVDSTGAGDAFIGAFAAALARGAALGDALRYGAVAGALACRCAGAVPSLPSRAAIDSALAQYR